MVRKEQSFIWGGARWVRSAVLLQVTLQLENKKRQTFNLGFSFSGNVIYEIIWFVWPSHSTACLCEYACLSMCVYKHIRKVHIVNF